MKRWLGLLLGLLPFVLSVPGAQAAAADEAIRTAHQAAHQGDRATLARQLDAVRDHELAMYPEYWLLRLRLKEAPAEEIRDFLDRQAGSYLADRLRAEWLRELGKQGDWVNFDREYPPLVQTDQEITCYALQSRLRLNDSGALDEARPLWFAPVELPDACMPLMAALIARGRLDSNAIWERARRLLELRKYAAARAVLDYLPAAERPSAKTLEAIADKPLHHLLRSAGQPIGDRASREMMLFAVQRLTQTDPQQAARQWQKIEDRFPAADRHYLYGQLGWQAAWRHLPEALQWYALAEDAPLTEVQLSWKVRAALRAGDWRVVREAIGQMPAALQAQPDWIYWLARAQAALGRPDEAQALYRRIAGQPNFYGNLAGEELGQAIEPPPNAQPATLEEVDAIASRPGIRRALALFRLDMRLPAIREWNWSLRDMDDRQLLAAAELARRNEIFDRAINTADRTQVLHNFSLRYLAPFREAVAPKARALDLDPGWVYGLMRQESRFITDAHSSAGAKGLMQLMPKTAAWVARKIGLKDYHPGQTNDREVNVTLGTHYLKMVLDDLDNHPVLASAAYNAGPGRARKWRDNQRPLEGAIYAETIPFNETRDYVKKVMSNTVFYAALFDGHPQSLKHRLGFVAPKRDDPSRGSDLP